MVFQLRKRRYNFIVVCERSKIRELFFCSIIKELFFCQTIGELLKKKLVAVPIWAPAQNGPRGS